MTPNVGWMFTLITSRRSTALIRFLPQICGGFRFGKNTFVCRLDVNLFRFLEAGFCDFGWDVGDKDAIIRPPLDILTKVNGAFTFDRFSQTKRASRMRCSSKVVGHPGFEPGTNCLRGNCSAVELMTLAMGKIRARLDSNQRQPA